MCVVHLFLKLFWIEWKESYLDKSLKQKSAVPRIFVKISETTLTWEKKSNDLYDGKICERVLCVITFTCKWSLTFQLFNLNFNKKFKVCGPNFLGPDS